MSKKRRNPHIVPFDGEEPMRTVPAFILWRKTDLHTPVVAKVFADRDEAFLAHRHMVDSFVTVTDFVIPEANNS